jgi:methyl-accepting chemotaxis protein
MNNRRRKFYVKEGDHQGLLLGALILILVLVVLASGLFYVIANRNLEQATYRAHFEILRNTMQMLLPWLLIVNIIGIIAVLILAIFMTHKISGPAYHLIKDLRCLQEGDLTIRTKFRKGDRLKNVAIALSDASGALNDTIIKTKTGLEELSKETSNYPEIKKKVIEISKTLDKLKT